MKKVSTREKILKAAEAIIVREGLACATTRRLAAEAGVNEVTLFRHFKSKEKLLANVIGNHLDLEALSSSVEIPEPTGNLREDFIAFGKVYARVLQDNILFIRTMLGETLHDNCHEKDVFLAIFRVLKDARDRLIERAVAANALRNPEKSELYGELFVGVIFSNILKRSIKKKVTSYELSEFIEFTADLILGDAGDTKPAMQER